MSSEPHEDAPPSYHQATGSSNTSSRPSNLEVPNAKNGIPAAQRRSMEDESRPLPDGWIRQFDAKENHQFFVDTKAQPPRSIWHHPYDDDDFLRSLSSEERERIQEQERNRKEKPSLSDDEAYTPTSPYSAHPDLPPRPSVAGSTSSGKKGFGTKLKDKLTGSTHEERQEEKRRRDEQEREYYIAHQKMRECMQRAQMTGQPQFFAKDGNGKDIYVEPPNTGYGPYGQGGYGPGAYGYNPYSAGVYQNPNARFIRPGGAYGRPYGGAYGGGMGMPIAGGLLGGMLLGGLLF